MSVPDGQWFRLDSALAENANGHALRCTLELDDFAPVETEIDAKSGTFAWRGWKKFLRQHGAKEGDWLVFSRQEAGRFSVTVQHSRLAGTGPEEPLESDKPSKTRSAPRERCNDLSGDEWLRYSLSVWSDIRKSSEELALNHPAMFPSMLCERLIKMFLRRGERRILDPFMGSGSTLVAAQRMGMQGIGLEISDSYIQLAKRRLAQPDLFGEKDARQEIHQADTRNLLDYVGPESIDLCITSPPYWDILNQKRTADYKDVRHYGNLSDDLGTVHDYEQFLDELAGVFGNVLEALKPGAYCVVVVMDLRKKNRFFAYHSDLAERLTDVGFLYDDLIIWDRGHEYNNLRPLGYPSVFRINKIHEFILIFQKPKASR